MDPTAIAFVILAGLALIIFLVIKNKKDKKDLVNKLNQDYKKTRDEENDTPAEDFPK